MKIMMIRSDKHFRLSEKDKHQIRQLTGSIPETTTIRGFNNYLETAKLQYGGDTPEEILIRHLIDKCKIDPHE